MSDEMKKKIKIAVPVMLGVAGGVVAITLGVSIRKDTLAVRKLVESYIPFTDMTKEAAMELLKATIDGTATIADAQILDGDLYTVFIQK